MTVRYRSNFENNFATFLDNNHINYEYERIKLRYTPKERKYTPDFYLVDHDMFIETKGRFVASDRAKHLLIQEQYPGIDLRFVFQKAGEKISRNSKTTYGEWCHKHGFQYAQEEIPRFWLKKGK